VAKSMTQPTTTPRRLDMDRALSGGFAPAASTRDLLDSLASRELSEHHKSLLHGAEAHCRGSQEWRQRKLAEAQSLMALCQVGPPGRLFVLAVDLSAELRTHIHMGVPVPVALSGRQIEIVRHARMVIRYSEAMPDLAVPEAEAVTLTFPGHDVWHPSVASGHGQALALGDRIERRCGSTLVEIVLRAYEVLSLRAFVGATWDCQDVLNEEALEWWQSHRFRIPLTTRPYFVNDAPSS
jgi:hypothetical protein